MLEYDKIDMSEEIDVNKTIGWRECIIRYDWYIPEINFRIQPKAHNGCHDLMQKAISFNNAATVFFFFDKMIVELISSI